MKIVNLLFAYPKANDLAHLSRKVGEALGGLDLEERESSNYVDGRYFAGSIENIRIVLALSDETDHDDLPYWLALSSNEMPEVEIIAFADMISEEKLLPNGFCVSRFVYFARQDEQRIDY